MITQDQSVPKMRCFSLKTKSLICRSALLVAQDPKVVISALMKLAGGTPSYAHELDIDSFLEQARSYDEATASPLGTFLKNSMTRQLTHPLPVMRAREIDRWALDTQYRSLLSRNRTRSDTWVDLDQQSQRTRTSDFILKIKLTYFWDVLTLNISFMIIIHNFRGDLTRLSAKIKTLLGTCLLLSLDFYEAVVAWQFVRYVLLLCEPILIELAPLFIFSLPGSHLMYFQLSMFCPSNLLCAIRRCAQQATALNKSEPVWRVNWWIP